MKYERGVILTSVLAVLLIILYFLFRQTDTLAWMVVRAAGLMGYLALFLAILSSEYLTKMRGLFGRSYINVHHHLARVGVALVLIHPVTVASQLGIDSFVPVFYPFMDFLMLAGRTAFYIIIIAVLAGVYRRMIPRKWRYVHELNYLAFVLVFIHAWLIGIDLQNAVMQFIWLAMALVVIGVFIHKHLLPSSGRRKATKKKSKQS